MRGIVNTEEIGVPENKKSVCLFRLSAVSLALCPFKVPASQRIKVKTIKND
jgi:hypothetical protein